MKQHLANYSIALLLTFTLTSCRNDGGGIELDTGECAEFTFYQDSDKDGYGDPDFSTVDCEAPEGWVDNGDDCDDTDKTEWDSCPGDDCSPLDLIILEESTEDDTGETDANTEPGDTGDVDAPPLTNIYYYCSIPQGWQAARQICEAELGGDLAAAGQPGEFKALQDSIIAADIPTSQSLWLGLYQQSTAPSVDFGWFWVQNEGYPESDSLSEGGVWHPNEPDNGGFEENYGEEYEEDVAAFAFKGGQWGAVDLDSTIQQPYLCEVR
jgi:hypothetical protein